MSEGHEWICILPLFFFISAFHPAVPTCKAEPGKADSVSTSFWKEGQQIVNTLQKDDGLGKGGVS